MTMRTLTALFDSYDAAATAVTKLEEIGVPHSDISLVSNKGNGKSETHATADHAVSGAGTGATIGTLVGGGAGLLAGLGLMAIPGVGPVVAAGWLVATLTGAGVGAAAGGLAGSLTDAGVSEGDAHAYAEGVRRGGTLLTVRVDEARSDDVERILVGHGALDLDERAADWQRDGWAGESNTVSSDTGTSAGFETDADATGRAGEIDNGSMIGTAARQSGARRVRIYDHPV